MNIRKSFMTLLCLILINSCAKVTISDGEFCGDMGSEGATCFKALSGETRDIPPEKWEKERFGMICSESSTFANWKKAIMKLCKMTKRCNYSVKRKINKFGRNIKELQVMVDEI